MAKCIVLSTTRDYSDSFIPFLRELLSEQPDLFAVVGTDCAKWEDAIDWLVIEPEISGTIQPATCCTTSHPGESLEEVIAFAKQWCDLNGWLPDIKVQSITS